MSALSMREAYVSMPPRRPVSSQGIENETNFVAPTRKQRDAILASRRRVRDDGSPVELSKRIRMDLARRGFVVTEAQIDYAIDSYLDGHERALALHEHSGDAILYARAEGRRLIAAAFSEREVS